jgi:hypothetical protein
MRMDRYLPPDHPLSKVYRVGAAIFGAGLICFGVLGLADRLPFLSTNGIEILGLSSDGLLSVISIVVGAILICAAAWGGAIASTTTSVIGGLFFLSGLANLAVLDTAWNLLAFKLQNVCFSLVAGMLLMFLGLYGRVSGGLPQDNPYVRRRHNEPPDGNSTEQQRRNEQQRLTEIKPLVEAEIAFAEGHPTSQQERIIRAEAWRHAQAERRRAYEHYKKAQGGEPNLPTA